MSKDGKRLLSSVELFGVSVMSVLLVLLIGMIAVFGFLYLRESGESDIQYFEERKSIKVSCEDIESQECHQIEYSSTWIPIKSQYDGFISPPIDVLRKRIAMNEEDSFSIFYNPQKTNFRQVTHMKGMNVEMMGSSDGLPKLVEDGVGGDFMCEGKCCDPFDVYVPHTEVSADTLLEAQIWCFEYTIEQCDKFKMMADVYYLYRLPDEWEAELERRDKEVEKIDKKYKKAVKKFREELVRDHPELVDEFVDNPFQHLEKEEEEEQAGIREEETKTQEA